LENIKIKIHERGIFVGALKALRTEGNRKTIFGVRQQTA